MSLNLFVAASILSFSLQGWHDFWQGLTVISLAIAFIAGYGVNRTSKRMGNLQDREIRGQKTELVTLSTKLAEQREKTANAELELIRLAAHQGPRVSVVGDLNDALATAIPGKAEILYQEGDGEVLEFAHFLQVLLKYRGWDVPIERPIGDTVSGSYSGISLTEVMKWPPPRRLGASPTGVSIIINGSMLRMLEKNEPNAFTGLLTALNRANVATGGGQTDSGLPDDLLRIVIAPR